MISCTKLDEKEDLYTGYPYGYTVNVENSREPWNRCTVRVLKNDVQVFEYKRGYSFLNTFYPYQVEGVDHFIYSDNYQETVIYSTKDGELKRSKGVCPTGFWVPRYKKYKYDTGEFVLFESEPVESFDKDNGESDCKVTEEGSANFLFRLGCIWGDDSCWKLDLLSLPDLNKLSDIDYEDYFGGAFEISKIELNEDRGNISIQYPKLEYVRFKWR